jgi:O-antigen ligase
VSDSYQVALPWIRWALLYAALTSWVLVSREKIILTAINIIFLHGLVVIDTLWQYKFGISLTGHAVAESYRLTGPMDNVKVGIFLAKLCFPCAGIMFYFALTQRRRRFYVLAVAAYMAICLVTVMLSGERTAFFSSVVALSVIAVAIGVTDRRHRLIYFCGYGFFLLLLVFLLATQPPLQGRLTTLIGILENFKYSSYGQLFWVGYQLGLDNLMTGTGFKGFRVLCLGFLESGIVDHCNLHPHNPYMEWFAEAGLPGLIGLFTLVGAMLHRLWKACRAMPQSAMLPVIFALATVIVHFFPLLATQSFFSNWPALLLWYSISMGFASLALVSGDSSVLKQAH